MRNWQEKQPLSGELNNLNETSSQHPERRRIWRLKRNLCVTKSYWIPILTVSHQVRHRYNHLPQLAKFLLSSDRIDTDISSLSPQDVLKALQPPRKFGTSQQHAAIDSTVFYLPAKLLPWQEELISKRSALVKDAAEKEWAEWVEERTRGLEEVERLKKQAEELAKVVPDNDEEDSKADGDMKVDEDNVTSGTPIVPSVRTTVGGSESIEY